MKILLVDDDSAFRHVMSGELQRFGYDTAAAGTGIGGAAARRCLEEGALVAISDRHHERLAAARDELAATGAVPLEAETELLRLFADFAEAVPEATITAETDVSRASQAAGRSGSSGV